MTLGEAPVSLAHQTGRRGFLAHLIRLGGAACFLRLPSLLHADDRNLVWPSPNRSFLEGKPPDTFLQPTSSGRLESALFGCVRNGGTRFHEGLDLKSIQRDRSRESTDPIFAIMPGTVTYINRVAGRSSYGRYVVLQHEASGVTFYTLYAHLRSIPTSLSTGQEVNAGSRIAVMGRSAGGYTIPTSRAHLHLEIGFQLQRNFNVWFSRQGFGSPNFHGAWNGMNLVGLDPLDYYEQILSGKVRGIRSYLGRLPVAARTRVHFSGVPDFVRRNPGLVVGYQRGQTPASWEIDFAWFGLPVRWRPVYQKEERSSTARVEILGANRELLTQNRCRNLITFQGDNPTMDRFLRSRLEILFLERL